MKPIPGIDEAELVKCYRSRYAALTNERAPFISLWTDIRNFIAPRTARFPGEIVNNASREDLNMINCSPRFAVRTLAAGLQSGVTSPMRPWFKLGTPDPDLADFAPVKEWLYIVETRMRQVMSRSNMYDRLKSNYAILGTYGTSGFGIDEDEKEIIRCYDYPMGSFMLSTDYAGRVNTMYRDVNMTASQIVARFGKGVHTQADVAMANSNYDNRFWITQIVEPNKNYKPGSALSHQKRFASIYLEQGQNGVAGILGYKGYDDLPVMGPRWDVVGEDIYGFGCGETALGDSKQTQLMERRKLQKLDKHVNPAMLADASMRSQRTENMPGGTTYVNGLITGKPGYQPAYQLDSVIEQITNEILRVEGRIDEAFFKNLFLAITEIGDQPNITATQIIQMKEEKLLMLGPVLERLDDDLLDKLIDRLFNIMFKRGMFPPPPKEIQGQPLRVEYISVLAQAQKAIGVATIERFIGFVGNMFEVSQDASVWDKVNKDEAIDQYADGSGVTPLIINNDETVTGIRDSRQKQAAAAQATQMGMASAEAAKNLAASDTGGDNALTRMVGLRQ